MMYLYIYGVYVGPVLLYYRDNPNVAILYSYLDVRYRSFIFQCKNAIIHQTIHRETKGTALAVSIDQA